MRKPTSSEHRAARTRPPGAAAILSRHGTKTILSKPGAKLRAAGPGRNVRRLAAQAARAQSGNGRTSLAPGSVEASLRTPQRLDRIGPAGRTAPAGASRGKYVYCVIHAGEPLRFGPIGIGTNPSEVFTVHYRELAAVVSDTPPEALDSTREHVLAHERVNEIVMRDHTVIPMSFGTIFKTREDIVQLLRSAANAFGDVLQKMQNKLEFGLKVLWDREQVIHDVEREEEDILRLKKEISARSGPTYFARMQYGRLVDAALQVRSERFVAAILEDLRDVSVASRINKPIGDRMIMNAAFLILRDREAEFDARVKAIASRLDKLTFKYTGPWPPYNFVNIRLKLERA